MNEKNCELFYDDIPTLMAFPSELPSGADKKHYVPDELLKEYAEAQKAFNDAIERILKFVKASGQTVP